MASFLKKLDKKNRKHQHVVTKETGAVCLMSPTKTLAICNAGLVNGLSEEVIVEHFSSYGIIDRIMLLPGKSCSFIKYRNVSSAVEAYNKINGVLNIAQYSKPVFLSYVEDLPNVEYKKSYDILPPGVILIENFITEEEEKELLLLNESLLQSTISMKHRKVQHYGYEFKYAINNVNKDEPLAEGIPEQYHFILSRLRNKCKTCEYFYPDQLTINCYQPGQGIPPHIDTHSAFEDPIVSLSLGSSIVMDFKHDDSTHLCVLLPQRSLLVMSDESRYAWTHGIIPKKFDVIVNDSGYNILHRQTRISLTFRKVRMGECNCIYRTKCDSQVIHSEETNLDNLLAVKLEEVHVHKVYEEIAQHFDYTRHTPWPNVVSFIKGFKTGSLIIDVGCGNGKYLANDQKIFNIGCDRSSKLMEICTSKGFEVFICNSINIPLKDNVADGVISIAVIHHMANEERRLQAIREIVRILRIGGKALIYVWAKDQIRDDQKSGYVKQVRRKQRDLRESDIDIEQKESFTLIDDITLPIHKNRSNFKHKDLLVPWKLKKGPQINCNDTFLRYYHVFEESELENLCKTIDGIVIVKHYYDEGNWCVIIEKIK